MIRNIVQNYASLWVFPILILAIDVMVCLCVDWKSWVGGTLANSYKVGRKYLYQMKNYLHKY